MSTKSRLKCCHATGRAPKSDGVHSQRVAQADAWRSQTSAGVSPFPLLIFSLSATHRRPSSRRRATSSRCSRFHHHRARRVSTPTPAQPALLCPMSYMTVCEREAREGGEEGGSAVQTTLCGVHTCDRDACASPCLPLPKRGMGWRREGKMERDSSSRGRLLRSGGEQAWKTVPAAQGAATGRA